MYTNKYTIIHISIKHNKSQYHHTLSAVMCKIEYSIWHTSFTIFRNPPQRKTLNQNFLSSGVVKITPSSSMP